MPGPKDDRDRLRTVTPPAGVRAQTARPISESFDDETPVDGDPVSQINTRAKNAAANSRAAFGAIAELRREVRANNQRDIDDHQVMTRSMDGISSKVDKLSEHVGNIREDMGEVRGKLHILVNELAADRAERAAREKIKVEAELEIQKAGELAKIELEATEKRAEIDVEVLEKKTEIEDKHDENKHRRARNLKITAGIVTLLGVLATALSQC